jgi:hypothetical protein
MASSLHVLPGLRVVSFVGVCGEKRFAEYIFLKGLCLQLEKISYFLLSKKNPDQLTGVFGSWNAV